MIKNEESLEETLVEDSKNMHKVLENSENMVIKEEPLDESDDIKETDKLQNKKTYFQPEQVKVKEEPFEENNQISEPDQPMNVREEPYDSIDIKIEIKEEKFDDEDILSDIDVIEDEGDDDIPSDIG